ncbi:hisD [Symbiodinium microadriaticum]|nr:hisD [Symbiodinium microadriaticum]
MGVTSADPLENVYFTKLIQLTKEKIEERILKMDTGDTQVKYKIQLGSPYNTLVAEVAEEDVDLVIMGTEGAEGLDEFFVGSNAEKVVRNAKCPVITIREVNTPANFTTQRHDLEQMQKFVEDYDIKDYTIEIYNYTNEEDGIVYYAEDVDADMVALGTNQRTGFDHFLLGSIAEDVVNHSKRKEELIRQILFRIVQLDDLWVSKKELKDAESKVDITLKEAIQTARENIYNFHHAQVQKELTLEDAVAIDMPAGPSEVMVVIDKTAKASFAAADLLSQAEHGIDSQVVLVSKSQSRAEKVLEKINNQLERLPRKEIAKASLANSAVIIAKKTVDILDIINEYAPEHLILNMDDAVSLADGVSNAGSVFIGPFTPESAGDYASGTNHTLPTNGWARSYSGVSLDSFTKSITYQTISEEGIRKLGPTIEKMAAAELLEVLIYLRKIQVESDFLLVMVSNQDGLGTEKYPEQKFYPMHNLIMRNTDEMDSLPSTKGYHLNKFLYFGYSMYGPLNMTLEEEWGLTQNLVKYDMVFNRLDDAILIGSNNYNTDLNIKWNSENITRLALGIGYSHVTQSGLSFTLGLKFPAGFPDDENIRLIPTSAGVNILASDLQAAEARIQDETFYGPVMFMLEIGYNFKDFPR